MNAMVEFLCSESWYGRWNPLRETNIRPLAEHTAAVLATAVICDHEDRPHPRDADERPCKNPRAAFSAAGETT